MRKKTTTKKGNGFRNVVIEDRKGNVVHTLRHIPVDQVDQIRRGFYRVLIQKCKHNFAIRVTPNGDGE